MSGKSMQTCPCGWSKMATPKSLQTHQEKKGCIQKIVSVPEEQLKFLQCFDKEPVLQREMMDLIPDQLDQFDAKGLTQATLCGPFISPKKEPEPKLLNQATAEAAAAETLSSQTEIKQEACVPAANVDQSQEPSGLFTDEKNFTTQPNPEATEATVDVEQKEDKPSASQQSFQSAPSQTQEVVLSTAQQLNSTAASIPAEKKEAKPLTKSSQFSGDTSQKTTQQNFTTQPNPEATEATVEMDTNQLFFETPHKPLQSSHNCNKTRRALDFAAPQLNSTAASIPAEKKGAKPLTKSSQFNFSGDTSQKTTQQWAFRPQSFGAQPTSANGGKEANSTFGEATQSSFNFSFNGNKGFDLSTAAQQQSVSKPESVNSQPTVANSGVTGKKENKPMFGGATQSSCNFSFNGNRGSDLSTAAQQNFGTLLNPEATQATGKMDNNQPLFGTPHKPLQSSDEGNKTQRALGFPFGAAQSVFKPQSFSTQPTSANGGKEEANSFFRGTTQPPFSFSGTRGFDLSTAAQQQSVLKPESLYTQPTANGLVTGKEEKTADFGTTLPQFNFCGNRGVDVFTGAQQSVSKPKPANTPPAAANGGATGKEQNTPVSGAVLPQFILVDNGTITQRGVDLFSGAQQSFSRPESFSGQPPAANGGGAQEENKSLFQTPPPPVQSSNNGKKNQSSSGLLSGTQQFTVPMSQNLSTRPTPTKTDVPDKVFGSPQHPSTTATSLQTPAFGAQKPISQTPTPQPGPKTSAATAENKPGSKMSQPTTKFTGAPQHVQTPVSRSSPVTPKPAVQKENKSLTERPQQPSQSATHVNKTKGAPDFSTGAQQAQISLAIPTLTSQEMPKNKLQKDKKKAEIRHKIRSRELKLAEVRSSAKTCEGSLDKEWLEINNVFSDVIKVVEEACQRALQPLENRREKLKKEAHSLIKKLQEDIEKLEKAMDEVDSAADLDEDSLTTLKSQDLKKMQVKTSFSFGILQSTVSNMMEQIQEELGKLSAVELKRAPSFAVDVKLDPTTAHHFLVVSKDGKKVQDGGQSQLVPASLGRFDLFGSILGANNFSSGRSYWEVEVGNKSGWDLGVTLSKANRKGKLTLNPGTGYWAIVHYEEDKYAALTAPPVCLELKDKPLKVGVFLDYEEGLVSFYNVTTRAHIHSFTKCSFNDNIFPYFSPHPKNNGKNSEPLVISPVKN